MFAVALGLGACASQIAVSSPSERGRLCDDGQGRHEELVELEASVAAALERDACEEDLCPTALRICELADQICVISERHEGDRELASRCADGRSRCERVTTRVDEACGC